MIHDVIREHSHMTSDLEIQNLYACKAFCILFSFRLSFIWLRSVFILSSKHKSKDQEYQVKINEYPEYLDGALLISIVKYVLIP